MQVVTRRHKLKKKKQDGEEEEKEEEDEEEEKEERGRDDPQFVFLKNDGGIFQSPLSLKLESDKLIKLGDDFSQNVTLFHMFLVIVCFIIIICFGQAGAAGSRTKTA